MTEPIALYDQPQPFRRAGLGYELHIPGALLRTDYLKRHGEDLHCRLTIEATGPAGGHIHGANFNLASLTARQSLAKVLARRVQDVAWERVLEELCLNVIEADSKGEPGQEIGGSWQADDIASLGWAIDGLIPLRVLTWWYGARASVKSQLAALMAICKTESIPFLEHYAGPPGRVAILDWEDSPAKWNDYLRLIAAGLDLGHIPRVYYRRCRGPLERSLNQVAKELDDWGAEFLIVDSFGLAGGSTSEHSSWDDTVLRFKECLDELKRTAVVIDHISHAARTNRNQQELADPIGSQYKLALARAGYLVRKKQNTGSHEADVGIFDQKHNRVKPKAVHVTWRDDAITFDLTAVEETPLSDALKLSDRLSFLLRRHGALAVADMRHQLEHTSDGPVPSEDTIRRTLNRGRGTLFDKSADGEKWSTAARLIYAAAGQE